MSIHAPSGATRSSPKRCGWPSARTIAPLPGTLRDVLLGRAADSQEPTQEFLGCLGRGQRVYPTLVAVASDMAMSVPLRRHARASTTRPPRIPGPIVRAMSGTPSVTPCSRRRSTRWYPPSGEVEPASTRPSRRRSRNGGGRARTAELAYHWYAAHDLRGARTVRLPRAGTAEEARRRIRKRSSSTSARQPGTRSQTRGARGRDCVDLRAALANVSGYTTWTRRPRSRPPIRLVDEAVDRFGIGSVERAPRPGRGRGPGRPGEAGDRAGRGGHAGRAAVAGPVRAMAGPADPDARRGNVRGRRDG